MNENENLAFVCSRPWVRLNGSWYTRQQGLGWTRYSGDALPAESYYGKMNAKQWAAYRGGFVDNGLFTESEADAIADALTDPPARKQRGESQAALAVVAIETEKPNPDELGLGD